MKTPALVFSCKGKKASVCLKYKKVFLTLFLLLSFSTSKATFTTPRTAAPNKVLLSNASVSALVDYPTLKATLDAINAGTISVAITHQIISSTRKSTGPTVNACYT